MPNRTLVVVVVGRLGISSSGETSAIKIPIQ
ncbi:hypothetical protein C5167_004586, partial [Papaver somniferum]